MTIYAVSGVEPLLAWIPSLDTAGNGTTTLTDLSGNGRDGTLTNMNAATDWVADTANGGVRALDFDGTDDVVASSWTGVTGTSARMTSLWFKTSSSGTEDLISWGNSGGTSAGTGYNISIESGVIWLRSFSSNTASAGSGLDDGAWHHLVIKHGASVTTSSVEIWVDGASLTPTAAGSATLNTTAVNNVSIGKSYTTAYGVSRIDDVRIFDQNLAGSAVAYLYGSGNGRGVVLGDPGWISLNGWWLGWTLSSEPSVAVSVTPSTGSLTLTGLAPTVSTPVTVTPATGSVILTGLAPTVSTPVGVTPSTGSLALTGLAPTVSTPVVVTPVTGVLTISGFAPGVATPVTVVPETGVLVITGFAPTVNGTAVDPQDGWVATTMSRVVHASPFSRVVVAYPERR